MRTTLIITTYNWPEALEIVLISVLKQSIYPNEIIIADDGSTTETKKLINDFSRNNNIEIKHIWQKDNGFQKTSILNKAILLAENEYIIQIDGDILLHKDFIKDHIYNAKEGRFTHGSRVFLNKKITKKIIYTKSYSFSFFQKGISNRFNGIYSIFLSRILSSNNNNLKGTRGCNFSFWKSDFISVNGYNEDMKGWGKEDTELSARLINIGLKKNQLKCLAICYHLFHNSCSKKGFNINKSILENVIKNKTRRCKNGVNISIEINKAKETLEQGGIILYASDTIWGIGCDATNKDAVSKIFELKNRTQSKALISLVANKDQLTTLTNHVIPKEAERKQPTTIIYKDVTNLASNLIADDGSAGIRIVQDSFCKKLIEEFNKPIVSTSANISKMKTPNKFSEISNEIKDNVDYIVNLRLNELMTNPSNILLINTDGTIKKIR